MHWTFWPVSKNGQTNHKAPNERLITHIRKFVLKSTAFKCQTLVNAFCETTRSKEVQQLEGNIHGVLAVEDVTNLSWTIHWLPDSSLERSVKKWRMRKYGRRALAPHTKALSPLFRSVFFSRCVPTNWTAGKGQPCFRVSMLSFLSYSLIYFQLFIFVNRFAW